MIRSVKKTHIVISPPIRKSKPIIRNDRSLREYSPGRYYNVDMMDNPYSHWCHTAIYPAGANLTGIDLHRYTARSKTDKPTNTNSNITWWWKHHQYQRLNVNPEVNTKLKRLWSLDRTLHYLHKCYDCIDLVTDYHHKEIPRNSSIYRYPYKLQKTDRLKSGDTLMMVDAGIIVHYGIHIDQDLILSKIGDHGPVCIATYSRLADLYQSSNSLDLYQVVI